MKFKRSGSIQVASPDSIQKAAYEAKLEQYRNNTVDASGIVNAIGRLTVNVPQLKASVADYRFTGIGHCRLSCKPVRIAKFLDGFVLAGMESNGDIRTTHRLRVQEKPVLDSDEPASHYTQTISGGVYIERATIIDTDGLTEIGESEAAMTGLRLLHNFATGQEAIGWPDAHSLESLQPYRLSRLDRAS